MLKNVAQKMAVVTAPAIVAMGADRALSAVTTFSHILSGQGAGSGWDNSETRVAASLVHSATPVIFDVGANNGKWSRRLSDVLGPGAAFHLFECAPICFDELEINRAAISNAVHVNVAVSDHEGTATLHFPRASGLGGGLGSLHARKDVCVPQIDYDTIEARTIRLDDYADQAGVGEIDLLKMDIEGHELFAMQGAERLFRDRRVKALTFEFGSANLNSRTFFRDLWDLLGGHGFKIRRIVPGGRAVPVTAYSETLEYFRGATNYAAIL